MNNSDKAVDVALQELSRDVNPHNAVNLTGASLAVQRSVELPYGREKITAFKAALTAADITEVRLSEPEDFND